jgi:hypothetical protein
MRRDVWNSEIGQAAPEFLNFFPENRLLASWMRGVCPSCLLPDTVGQRVVAAVFPLRRISGKKFQKIGLVSFT